MFPWYVNAGLVCLVIAAFWGIWTSSASTGV
jgi:hypothetical protein